MHDCEVLAEEFMKERSADPYRESEFPLSVSRDGGKPGHGKVGKLDADDGWVPSNPSSLTGKKELHYLASGKNLHAGKVGLLDAEEKGKEPNFE